MPKYFGKDYFLEKILREEARKKRFLIKPPILLSGASSEGDVFSIIDELYRRPWDSPATVTERTEFSAPDKYTISKWDLENKQEIPNSHLGVEEVAWGLSAEMFCIDDKLDPPIILETMLSDTSGDNLKLSEIHVHDQLSEVPGSNLGKEKPQSSSDALYLKRVSKSIIEHPIVLIGQYLSDLTPTNAIYPCVTAESRTLKLQERPERGPTVKSLEHPLTNPSISFQHQPTMMETISVRVQEKDHQELFNSVRNNLHEIERPCLSSRSVIDHPNVSLVSLNTTSSSVGVHDNFPEVDVNLEGGDVNLEILDELVWNPFELPQVALNIEVVTRLIDSQEVVTKLIDSQESLPDPLVVEYPRIRSEDFLVEEAIRLESDKMGDESSSPEDIHGGNYKSGKQLSDRIVSRIPSLTVRTNLSDSISNFISSRKHTIGPENAHNPLKVAPAAKELNVTVTGIASEPNRENIEIETDELTLKFVNRLIGYCKPDLDFLVSRSVLNKPEVFLTVDLPFLEFALKEGFKNKNKKICDILLRLVPIKQALDTATQLDTEVALDFLKSLEFDDTRFSFCLKDLSQIQFDIIYSGHKPKKLMRACEIIRKYHEIGKILILITNAAQCKSMLLDTLSTVSGVSIAPALSFSDHTCFLVNTEEIRENFPWEKFTIILEYCEVSKETRNLMCTESVKKHFSLTCVLPLCKIQLPGHEVEEYKIIAFSTVNYRVLQCLETEHNFVLFQRPATDLYSHESLVIDEKTCVVLISDLKEIKQVRLLSSLFIKLSLRYAVINLIFDLSTCHNSELFSVVFASVAHFRAASPAVRVFYCLTVEDTCNRVAKIAHSAREQISVQWKSTDLWLKRTWLTEDESSHEKVLTQIPCINAYVAQIMLTSYPLADLVLLSLPDLLQHISVIPVEILERFHRSLRQVNRFSPARSVQFDATVQEFSPAPSAVSPAITQGYQRTSLPSLNTSYDIGSALNSTFTTPMKPNKPKVRAGTASRIQNKPQNVVRPFVLSPGARFVPPSLRDQNMANTKHQNSFSYSKRRKVMVDKMNVTRDGQSKLFIGK